VIQYRNISHSLRAKAGRALTGTMLG
jgi:hypothetical protein